MSGPSLRIDHVAFPCFDVAETHRFYSEVLGFELVSAMEGRSSEWGGRAFLLACFATGSGQLLDFFQVEGHERSASAGIADEIRHVALAAGSRDELAHWRARLDRYGVPFEEDAHGGRHDSIYFRDPNGVQIEITWWNRRFDAGDAQRGLALLGRWCGDAKLAP